MKVEETNDEETKEKENEAPNGIKKNFSKTNVDQKFLNSVTDSVVGGVIENLINS